MHAARMRFRAVFLFAILHLLFFAFKLLPVLDKTPAWLIAVPSGEIVLLFALLARTQKASAARANPISFRAMRFILSSVIAGSLVFFSAGETFYRYYYLDHFHPLSDGRLIPGLFGMFFENAGVSFMFITIASWALTAVVLLGLGFLVSLAIYKVVVIPDRAIFKRARWSLCAAALVLIIVFPSVSPLAQTGIDFKNVVTGTTSDEPSPLIGFGIPANQEPVQNGGNAGTAVESNIPKLTDSDIHIMVIESYGTTLYMRKEYLDPLLPVYRELEQVLDSDGWKIYSGLVRSPAFGGRSWLADATILAGEQMWNQNIFDDRLSRDEPARLLSLMAYAGYHRIYAAPGTSRTSDSWIRAYPFEEYIIRYGFGYEGPFIGFGTMSDQYVLDRIQRNYLFDDRKEFVFYLLVSSHVPFETVPIYKPDWDFTQHGKEYESGYLQFFDNDWLSGRELAEGYIAGITYTLETVVRYLTERLSQAEFMLIIGDHQPRKPVSVPNADYPVPFHLVMPKSVNVHIPASWDVTNLLMPPPIPEDTDEVPLMAEITALFERLMRADFDDFADSYGFVR